MSVSRHTTPNGVEYRVRMKSWVPLMFGHDCVTIRRTIYCRKATLHRRTHAHEAAHVEQFARYGVLGFLWRYLREWFRSGYARNPFEIEAHQYAARYEADFRSLP